MKYRAIYLGILLSAMFVFMSCAQQDDFPVLKGPYLGQKPPGMTPELFAPGIVATEDNEVLYGFFNNGALFLFDRTPADLEEWTPAVYRMDLKDGKWTPPNARPYQGKPWYHYYTTAPEGEEVYFAWKGSLGDRSSSADVNIWWVRKTAIGWAEPMKLPFPIMQPTFIEALIPVCTPSPTMAPSLRRPVFRPIAFISFLSSFRFAILVPEPKLQSSPIMLSPM